LVFVFITIKIVTPKLIIYKKIGITFNVIIFDSVLLAKSQLHEINNINRTATLGIFIGNKKYWSKGYGTEAIQLILDFGFNYLNLNNIDLALMEFNQRALKCYEKCGFKEIGRKRKCNFINGKYYDSILMDILVEEFTDSYIKNKNIK